MNELALIVHWANRADYIEKEYITLNPDLDHQLIETTAEWCQPPNRFYEYNTRGKAEKGTDGKIQLTIQYKEEDNGPDVADSIWGTSRFVIDPRTDHGHLLWKPDGGKESRVKWHLVRRHATPDLFEQKKRRRTSSISRDESLRLAVLVEDRQCAITAENTPQSLDAAHVIAAADKGADCLDNAFLLRSDLHRLFDQGLFTVETDGTIRVTEKEAISSYYLKLLEGARIPQPVLRRIARALEHKVNVAT